MLRAPSRASKAEQAKPRRISQLIVAVLWAAGSIGGCATSTPSTAAGQSQSPSTPASAVPIPAPLVVPAGEQAALAARVQRGSQLYACAGGAWALNGPIAVLNSPSTDILHEGGPGELRPPNTDVLHKPGSRWTATVDGSSVTAQEVASASVPGAVPLQLLKATSHTGQGLLATVDYIQRLDTHGGQAPTSPCNPGQQRAVGYTAEYRFYAPTRS